MKVTRKSIFTGKISTLGIDVTQAQLDAYENGELLQRAMPNVPAKYREFIKTGVTPDEWNKLFGMN